jgi:flagellar basal body-associated protein FliL
MVQENDAIAIIIIVLFVILALIAFGIYRLVSQARSSMHVSSSSGSTSTSETSIVDG